MSKSYTTLILLKVALCFAAIVLAACGSEGSVSTGPAAADQPPILMPAGVAVIKTRTVGRQWATLVEHLRPIVDLTAPDRRLLTATDGDKPAVTIEPPAGWSLIDFALHPSGEITLVLASDSQLRLQRRAANGDLLGESLVSDELAETDPFIGDVGTIHDSQSLVPWGTRDAVRIAPLAEDLLLAFRTGRNAVIMQRLTLAGSGNFERRWRTIIEPGVPIDRVRLTSGTFDPFGSLDSQWQLFLDVDAQGRSAVAVSLGHTQLPEGHREYFGEPLDPALVSGAIVTVVDANGHRLGDTPIDTHVISEVHVVRWAGDTVLVAGRVFTTQRSDGGGWDGFLAHWELGDPAAPLQVLDFDRGDVIFDVAALGDGRIAIAGSTAYVQNPTGGSISESAEPLLAVLATAGSPAQRIPLSGGPRHNQVRTLAAWRAHWLLGGMQNGPGTHSADADPALLTCDGFLHEQQF